MVDVTQDGFVIEGLVLWQRVAMQSRGAVLAHWDGAWGSHSVRLMGVGHGQVGSLEGT